MLSSVRHLALKTGFSNLGQAGFQIIQYASSWRVGVLYICANLLNAGGQPHGDAKKQVPDDHTSAD